MLSNRYLHYFQIDLWGRLRNQSLEANLPSSLPPTNAGRGRGVTGRAVPADAPGVGRLATKRPLPPDPASETESGSSSWAPPDPKRARPDVPEPPESP